MGAVCFCGIIHIKCAKHQRINRKRNSSLNGPLGLNLQLMYRCCVVYSVNLCVFWMIIFYKNSIWTFTLVQHFFCVVLFYLYYFCVEKYSPPVLSSPHCIKALQSSIPAPAGRGAGSPPPPLLSYGSALKFSCDKCSYFTNRESKMEEHMAAHGGRWICSVCKKAFIKVM